MLVCGYYKSVFLLSADQTIQLTSIFRLIHNPVPVTNPDFVLVITLSNTIEVSREYQVRRCRLCFVHMHLQRLPWWVAKRRNYIDGRLYTRLRKDNGRAFGHGCTARSCGGVG
jgi:hypothetical protein